MQVRVLLRVTLAACALVSFLCGAVDANSASRREADPTRVLSCDARLSVADFDQNGIADRVEIGAASGHGAVWLTLNGRQRIRLAEPADACRLLVLDIDHDADPDLVALTITGRLLLWRNEGGALGLVQPQQEPDAANGSTSLSERARPPDSLVLNPRSVPCIIPVGQAYAHPFRVSRVVDIAGQHCADGSRRSASRAPPTS